MLIEEINKNFLLPIEFNNDKKLIFNNLYQDLELLKTHNHGTSVYANVFSPKSDIGKECLKKFPQYYTTDKKFIKNTQNIIKNMNNPVFLHDDMCINVFWENWNEIKNTEDFLEKFQYIEWEKLEFLNKSALFLSILTFYELSSPILSLFAPLILFLLPFIILKILKIPITINNYGKILIKQLDKHPIGQVFTRFKGLSWSQRLYLILCAGMYLYQIYQNVMSCYHFYINTSQINNTFKSMQIYLKYTIEKIENYLKIVENYDSYSAYKEYIQGNLNKLHLLYNNISTIPATSFNPRKILNLGKIMKEFYVLQTSQEIEHLLLFSFGFNGYIENINGLNKNIINKKMNKMAFYKSKKAKLIMKNIYHPCIETKIIKNNIDVSNNIIITGSNASGKTTILKATTINILLSQQIGYGFYKKGKMTPFDYIHCYLNIPDTNSRDSLFQAEARRCHNILNIIQKNSHKKHFCIFDELFSGTNPYEAISAAQAYLSHISNNNNVKFMLTTHYLKLCKMFNDNENIENFNMETYIENDEQIYTYKIKKGISKIKGGIMVLKNLGYPKNIIDNALNNIKKL